MRLPYNARSMATLIVTLSPQPAGPGTEFSWLLTPDGTSLASHGSAAAALLPQASGAGAEVVAVVPQAALSWHSVELPKGTSAGSPRLRAVLDGLLEDRLLDETDAIHFALQPQARPGAPVWVAACDRAWLRQSLQLLESAGRPVSRIVPEFTPEAALQLHVTGPHTADGQQAQLVLAGPMGILALPLAAPALALLPEGSADAPLVAEPGAAALAEQVLGRQVRIEQAPQRWLRAAQSDWDLAQFDMATSGRTRAFKRLATSAMDLLRAPQWRPARWGAALLVAVNLLGLNAWAWREHTALNNKREAIRTALTQTFPAVKVVVDAPVQMEREVAALRQVTGASSPRDLEAMLGALGQAAGSERPVAAVEYTAGELRARGPGYGPDAATTLAPGLQGLGYSAQMDGNTLVIKAEGAR